MRTMAALVLFLILPAPLAYAADRAPHPSTAYVAPRAPDGRPSLEGTWSNASLTRLERNPRHGSGAVLTDEEVRIVEGRNRALISLGDRPTDPNASVLDLPADCSDGRGTNCNYNAAWTDPGAQVMRVAGRPRNGFITSTSDGRVPARPRAAASTGPNARFQPSDNPEGRALGERCLLSFGNASGPVMLPGLYNNVYQFVQTRDAFVILVEMVHDVRIVRLNAAHRTDGVRPWMGDSIGWWDGESLVVETTGFHPQQNFRGASKDLKVTERFTRVSADRVHYGFWVEDPAAFAEAWGGEYEFSKSDGALYEYACHEGNYGLANILSGAREEDRTGVKTAPTNIDQRAAQGEGEEEG